MKCLLLGLLVLIPISCCWSNRVEDHYLPPLFYGDHLLLIKRPADYYYFQVAEEDRQEQQGRHYYSTDESSLPIPSPVDKEVEEKEEPEENGTDYSDVGDSNQREKKQNQTSITMYRYQWTNGGCDYSSSVGRDDVTTIGLVGTITFEACVLTCAINDMCNYFSYDSSRQLCFLIQQQSNNNSRLKNLEPNVAPGNGATNCGFIIQ